MRILDRHIIKEFVSCFILCILIFLFLIIIVDSFTNLDDFIKEKLSIAIVLKYYLAIVPTIFIQISPIACLIAMIYTIGKLNYNNELIAMRSGGLSIYEIVLPIFIIGVTLSLFSFLVSEKIIPRTQMLADSIKAKYIDKKPFSEDVIKNLAIYGFQNRQLFINTFNTKTNQLEGLTILEHDRRQNMISKVFANKVAWRNNSWVADQYLLYNFDKSNHVTNSQYFENYKLNIMETPEDFLRQRQKINYMNSKELFDYIDKLSGSGAETALRYLWIDFYQKVSAHFTCLIMLFIGLPCSIAIRRKAVGFSSIGISILVALSYYVMQAVSIALGKNSVFPPLASVLITPLIFISASVFLISIQN
ncbi:MAG: LptF/LptG family permease [Candidatus Omnitrophica bacterium]|nr:LptF/LptG family permease [Candidatus Omnitrophota bacterium]MDD5351950.1 LptF/LptG family permease [Candidatus Omnitrophota bacterium]MDD5550776.1 LptF/LptG family permease [Candidatus Omnitrophota bacterium]